MDCHKDRNALVESIQPMLYHMAGKLRTDRQLSQAGLTIEDIVADANVYILKRYSRWDAAKCKFSTWAWHQARSAFFGALYMSFRRKLFMTPIEGDHVDEYDQERIDDAIDGMAAWDAVNFLDTTDQQLLELRHIEDLYISQIAERVGSSNSTVQYQLKRAYGRLRKLLEILDTHHGEA